MRYYQQDSETLPLWFVFSISHFGKMFGVINLYPYTFYNIAIYLGLLVRGIFFYAKKTLTRG